MINKGNHHKLPFIHRSIYVCVNTCQKMINLSQTWYERKCIWGNRSPQMCLCYHMCPIKWFSPLVIHRCIDRRGAYYSIPYDWRVPSKRSCVMLFMAQLQGGPTHGPTFSGTSPTTLNSNWLRDYEQFMVLLIEVASSKQTPVCWKIVSSMDIPVDFKVYRCTLRNAKAHYELLSI